MVEAQTSPVRLRDRPGWIYLIQEFEVIYRLGSAGGSKAIRSHRKRVRDALAKVNDGEPEVVARAPEDKPVTAHLGRAFDLGDRGPMVGMSRALGRVAPLLTWEYGYEKVPMALAQKYAYCEVLGPRGPVVSDRITLGFVLFAPKTTYPQHSHRDIEESYVSIAGAWSENELAVYAPGSLILNVPGHEHRITTGDDDPCLLAYAWIGPPDKLTAPGMKFSSTKKRVEKGI
ncbi:dimethylsulfonioproprionate lyase family protein [Maritimibacter sp. DP1N21-5]|uniref:dimethylsulfonioproprionate lyase family protein n=1 Tax=Maritimibacter sp. DP1N21-5 TaxID=2836867 RepID=UPI001C437C46|nr:dimethylsulfonioproprionate lyase family protein [Maritimibacter sp. DP1N21-5]MBV7410558.1 dimethylsulfoniopropionate lyase [Maritimibacter sp. DP1N21-5]